jgi:hypothetical protein
MVNTNVKNPADKFRKEQRKKELAKVSLPDLLPTFTLHPRLRMRRDKIPNPAGVVS